MWFIAFTLGHSYADRLALVCQLKVPLFMTQAAEMVGEISSSEYRFSQLIFLTWPEGIICLNMKWSGGIGKLVNDPENALGFWAQMGLASTSKCGHQ